VLFTCPSRYSFTIGHRRVFSLGGWSPQLHARLLGSGVTQELHYDMCLVPPTGLSPSMAPRSRGLQLHAHTAYVGPTTPKRPKALRFGLFPVRSPLLRESRLISLPSGTEMFQFPEFASPYGDDGDRSPPGCPIRPSKDRRMCAPPLGLSQLTTAFIAFLCPGILHMLSLA
jgi:hypothetical protein